MCQACEGPPSADSATRAHHAAKPAEALVERDVRLRTREIPSATTDSLREKLDRRLVSVNFASWNQLNGWLRQVDGRRAA